MPLSFDSVSHGTIAFGFFNIDSDMLLLEHYFFFASDFCRNISDISQISNQESLKSVWQIYHIADSENIGDLMGAIHGIRYTGFIGELYKRFPFPEKPEDFRQKPEGFRNQAIVKSVIAKYAKHIEIPFAADENSQIVTIGQYMFSIPSFYELIRYIWQGGYPRWKDETRPDYVMNMKNKTEQSQARLFQGIPRYFILQ